ncbi:MAG: hypothetical protein ACYC1D_04530 [Acidimicrobiales bacterium]
MRERPESAMICQRVKFHLLYRVAVRFYLALSAGADPRAPRWQTWSAVACAAGDALGAKALQVSPRLVLAPRLAVDALDSALWSSVSPGVDDTPVLVGVPLAAEAGLRLGARGMVVPLASAALHALVQRRQDRQVRVAGFAWQVGAVVAGMVAGRYETHHRRVEEQRFARHLQARCEQARLAGQHHVAMRADSAVDLLMRTAPLLSPTPDRRIAGRLMQGWKEALTRQVADHATYLSVALGRWQAAHNDTPDLRADVEVSLPEDHGTLLLTPRQEALLMAGLDAEELRGPVDVRAVDAEGTRGPNTPIELRVNGRRLTIPPDPPAGVRPFDLGPVVLVAQAGWFFGATMRGQPEARRLAVAGPILASLGLAAWACLRVEQIGEAAHPTMVFGSLSLAATQTVAATATMSSPLTPAGLRRYPAASATIGAGILVALYWDELRSTSRAAAVGLLALIVGIGAALVPERLRAADLASELIWPLAAVLSARELPTAHRSDARARARSLGAEADRQVAEAFASGQALVARLVAAAVDQARTILEENRARLDPGLAVEAVRRLDQVDGQLEALR